MRSHETPLKLILRQRFYFLFEVLIVFLGIFIFMLIPTFLLPLLFDSNSVIFEPLFYYLRALILIAVIPLFLYLANFIMEKQRKKLILKEDISPSSNFLNLFKITKKNFKFQLLYGVLLLFLIFIPLDFFTYFLSPEMLSYMATVLNPAGEFSLNSYFNENYYTDSYGSNNVRDYPLIILIDQASASASEILAGAIQDYDRGLIVGTTSFGKGLVQREFTLDDNSRLRLTISKYYTPSGRLIQKPYKGKEIDDYFLNLSDSLMNENKEDSLLKIHGISLGISFSEVTLLIFSPRVSHFSSRMNFPFSITRTRSGIFSISEKV